MPSWKWAAASQQGRSHALAGERRQDVQRVQIHLDGSILVAVACDGAGCASHGGLGAALSARILTACARAHFTLGMQLPSDEEITSWFRIVRHMIADAAVRRNLSASDFASTVVMALSNGRCTKTAHVGDGAIVARPTRTNADEPLIWQALSWPDHGEYVSTTFFVTDSDLRLRIEASAIAVDRLIVMTDGLERLALEFAQTTPYAPFLEGLCAPLRVDGRSGCERALSRRLSQYLGSEAINDRTDDDKTLILAAFG